VASTAAWVLAAASPAGAATAPSITSPGSATALAGSPFTFKVTTSSATVPAIKAASLPAGLALADHRNGTATISGTPASTDGGVYKATITATVTGAPAAVQSLAVTVDNHPVFRSATTCTAQVGTAFSCAVATPHAYPIPTITTLSPLPAGVSLTDHHNDTATLGGTPAVGAGGVRGVTITAANGVGAQVNQTVLLTVWERPTITSPSSATLVEHAPMTPITVSATGYPVPKFTAAGLPTGLALTDHHHSRATIAGTPLAVPGSYPVTITAASTTGTTRAALALVVVAPTVPGAPTVGVVSIGTITIGNASAVVNFSPPATDGGSVITGYTVTAVDSTDTYNGGQTASGTTSPVTVTGLVNGDSYTFTVTATNALGTGPASAPSAILVPATESWPPTNATAIVPPAPNTAVVAFTPPLLDGGSVITGYTVTAAASTNPLNGGQTVSGPSSPITVTGLVNGDSYTFTVTATNGIGTSPASAPSNAVTPQVPPVPTISSVTPPTGTSSGGVAVTIVGAGFTGASSVVFGTTPATFTVNSDSTITATTPSGALGTVDVQVTTPGGTSAVGGGDQYTFTPPPDLAIAVTKPPVVYVGSAFTETYVITNDGGSPAVAPALSVLDGSAYASSVSVASMTCVDTETGHSGRDGGITHTGYQCSMPAGQVLPAGASLTLVASFVAGTATMTQQLTVSTASVQQNLVPHSVTDVTTPVLPAAPSTPTGVAVSQDAGSLVVAFTPGASTSPGAPITSSVTASPAGGGTALSGSVVTTTAGPATVPLPGLVADTTYSVAVTSADTGGSSSAVPVDFTTGPPSLHPGAPAITAMSWGTLSNIVATWTAAPPGDSATTDYQVLCTPSNHLSPVTYDAGTGLIASIIVPTDTVDWSVQVRAENAAGWGAWSPAMTIRALDN
jgi:hypothetical protein